MRAVLDSRLTGWSSFKRWLLSFFAHLRVLRVSLLLFSAALRLCESQQLPLTARKCARPRARVFD
jgi:hypothetical protein